MALELQSYVKLGFLSNIVICSIVMVVTESLYQLENHAKYIHPYQMEYLMHHQAMRINCAVQGYSKAFLLYWL